MVRLCYKVQRFYEPTQFGLSFVVVFRDLVSPWLVMSKLKRSSYYCGNGTLDFLNFIEEQLILLWMPIPEDSALEYPLKLKRDRESDEVGKYEDLDLVQKRLKNLVPCETPSSSDLVGWARKFTESGGIYWTYALDVSFCSLF